MTDRELMQQALKELEYWDWHFNESEESSPIIAALRERLSFLDATPQEIVKKVGSQAKLAEELGVSQQAVAHWCKQGCIPRKHHAYIQAWWGLL